MTVTGSTPARKKRKRGSACAAVGKAQPCGGRRGRSGGRRNRLLLPAVRKGGSGEDEAGGERCRAIDEEEVPERDRREDSADRRSDRHAEVDRQAVDGESRLAAGGLDGLGEERHRGRAEGFREHCEHDRDGRDGQLALGEGVDEERRPREEQRRPHQGHRPEPVAQPAGERSADDRAQAVQEQDEPTLLRREAPLARQVEDEEREDHRARAVDELRAGHDPDRPGQVPQVFPIFQHGRTECLRPAPGPGYPNRLRSHAAARARRARAPMNPST